jgi:hypothetical protein
MAKYIPDEILKPFLRSYEKGDVWQVHCGDKWLTVFLYSDNQIMDNKDLLIYQRMKREYFKLVDEYLDLHLPSSEDISVNFDSKENFEKKYQGDWYSYYH